MKIYSENFVFNKTASVNSGTAHPNYPITNISTLIVAEQIRCSVAGGSGQLAFTIDMGAAKTCDYIVLGGKSFSDEMGLKVGVADNGADFETSLISAQSTTSARNWAYAFTSTTKRYWYIWLSNIVVNTDYIGILFLGGSYETPHNEEPKINLIDNFRGTNINNIFHRGQIRTKQADSRRGQSGIVLANMTETQKDAFYAEFNSANTMNGISQPFFIEEDDGNISYVKFEPKRYEYIKNIEESYDIRFGVIEQL